MDAVNGIEPGQRTVAGPSGCVRSTRRSGARARSSEVTPPRLSRPRLALRRVALAAADLEPAARALQRRVAPLHRRPAAPTGLAGLPRRAPQRGFDARVGRHPPTVGLPADGTVSGVGALVLPEASTPRTT